MYKNTWTPLLGGSTFCGLAASRLMLFLFLFFLYIIILHKCMDTQIADLLIMSVP